MGSVPCPNWSISVNSSFVWCLGRMLTLAMLGEWYQAMGFDFLPHEHQGTAYHGAARGESTRTVPRDEQDDLLGRDATQKTPNALTMSSRLPEGGNLEVQRPYILDQLHSWEALMMEGSNSRVSGR